MAAQEILRTEFNYGKQVLEETVYGTLKYFSNKFDAPIKNNSVTVVRGQYTIVYKIK